MPKFNRKKDDRFTKIWEVNQEVEHNSHCTSFTQVSNVI